MDSIAKTNTARLFIFKAEMQHHYHQWHRDFLMMQKQTITALNKKPR
jgi:hypothetical protein